MKLNLDCFVPRTDSPRRQAIGGASPGRAAGGDDSCKQEQPEVKSVIAELDGPKSIPPPLFQARSVQDPRWISLGLPAAAVQQHSSASPRALLPMAASMSSSRLPDKIRHLGEILRSLDAKLPAENASGGFLASRKWISSPYRRNWLDLDASVFKDAGSMRNTPRDISASVRSTPRDSSNKHGFDLRGQLNGLEEMLQKSDEASKQRPRSKSSAREEKDDRSAAQGLEMDVLRDVLARLGRMESLSKATKEHDHSQALPTRVKQTSTKIEKKLRSFMSGIENHMERTDAAVKKVEKELQRLASSKKKPRKVSKVPDQSVELQRIMVGINVVCFSEVGVLDRHTGSSVLFLDDQFRCRQTICGSSARRTGSTSMQLCWSAMNQLCIDNEAFRQELQHLTTAAAPVKSKATKARRDDRDRHLKIEQQNFHREELHCQEQELADAYEQLKSSEFPGWSCSGMLQ
ncbi:hypothetical protein SELMODRAFT_413845 [Selaginella moellendorffii]|uniref:Uncharacterized protein n=1 Tax=Selaginella moellendorffii TaxID=88036 RepID=D8RQD9_SELML|nr:hypothetical protein SELMODRAFT_413845 [Selaginella moellendorffii]